MPNNVENRSYFRIGIFITMGIGLIIISILLLGSGLFFKKIVYAETYFKESVQGLTEGSSVKYLGMEIGTVAEINAVDHVYNIERQAYNNMHGRYIYVKMAIDPKFFPNVPSETIRATVTQHIASGLRVKLSPQGLTGNTYLEIAFVDPRTNPELPVSWIPKNFYIPSATSTLAYFTENAQYIVNELRQVDIQAFFDHIEQLVSNTNIVVSRADRLLAQTNRQLVDTVNNVQNIAQNVNALSEQARVYPTHILFGKPPPVLDPSKL